MSASNSHDMSDFTGMVDSTVSKGQKMVNRELKVELKVEGKEEVNKALDQIIKQEDTVKKKANEASDAMSKMGEKVAKNNNSSKAAKEAQKYSDTVIKAYKNIAEQINRVEKIKQNGGKKFTGSSLNNVVSDINKLLEAKIPLPKGTDEFVETFIRAFDKIKAGAESAFLTIKDSKNLTGVEQKAKNDINKMYQNITSDIVGNDTATKQILEEMGITLGSSISKGIADGINQKNTQQEIDKSLRRQINQVKQKLKQYYDQIKEGTYRYSDELSSSIKFAQDNGVKVSDVLLQQNTKDNMARRVINATSSLITKTDIESIKEFDSAIKNGERPIQAFKNYMMESSDAAKKFALDLAKDKKSIEDVQKASVNSFKNLNNEGVTNITNAINAYQKANGQIRSSVLPIRGLEAIEGLQQYKTNASNFVKNRINDTASRISYKQVIQEQEQITKSADNAIIALTEEATVIDNIQNTKTKNTAGQANDKIAKSAENAAINSKTELDNILKIGEAERKLDSKKFEEMGIASQKLKEYLGGAYDVIEKITHTKKGDNISYQLTGINGNSAKINHLGEVKYRQAKVGTTASDIKAEQKRLIQQEKQDVQDVLGILEQKHQKELQHKKELEAEDKRLEQQEINHIKDVLHIDGLNAEKELAKKKALIEEDKKLEQQEVNRVKDLLTVDGLNAEKELEKKKALEEETKRIEQQEKQTTSDVLGILDEKYQKEMQHKKELETENAKLAQQEKEMIQDLLYVDKLNADKRAAKTESEKSAIAKEDKAYQDDLYRVLDEQYQARLQREKEQQQKDIEYQNELDAVLDEQYKSEINKRKQQEQKDKEYLDEISGVLESQRKTELAKRQAESDKIARSDKLYNSDLNAVLGQQEEQRRAATEKEAQAVAKVVKLYADLRKNTDAQRTATGDKLKELEREEGLIRNSLKSEIDVLRTLQSEEATLKAIEGMRAVQAQYSNKANMDGSLSNQIGRTIQGVTKFAMANAGMNGTYAGADQKLTELDASKAKLEKIYELSQMLSQLPLGQRISAEKALNAQYQEEIKNLTNITNSLNSIKRDLSNKYVDKTTISKQIAQMEDFYSKNDGASKRMLNDLRSVITEMEKLGAAGKALPKDFDTVVTRFNEIKASMKKTGDTGMSIATKLGRAWKSQMASQIAMYTSFYSLIRYAKNAFNTIKELDTALVDLRKTTTMSTSELNDFYYEANESAKKLGVTTQELIQQAADWSRLNNIGPLYSNV